MAPINSSLFCPPSRNALWRDSLRISVALPLARGSERRLVGPDRFELSTPRLSSVCSNQLSYGPSPAAVVRKKRTPQLGSQNPRTDVRGREEKRRRRQPQMSSSSVKDAGRFLQSDREDLLEQQMSNRNRP